MKSPKAKYSLKINDNMTIFSNNEKMGMTIERVKAASKSDVNVLLIGKSGSGKELFAEAIHSNSGKSGKYFAVNCTAIPSGILESQLFGHIKGAFTGALCKRDGAFITSNNGTIFLDEIGGMDVSIQPKLLRAVEYKEFSPVGSDEIIRSNARVVAAINDDIGNTIASGLLREDLYYRIANYIIFVPTLEERIEDLDFIIPHIFEKVCMPKGITRIDDECIEKFKSYHWPGNIRELRAAIESAAINAEYRGGQKIELRDIDNFASALIRNIDSKDNFLQSFIEKIYNGKQLKIIEKEFRALILREILRIEDGNTDSIAKRLKLSGKAVRSMYQREGLPLGRSYKKR